MFPFDRYEKLLLLLRLRLRTLWQQKPRFLLHRELVPPRGFPPSCRPRSGADPCECCCLQFERGGVAPSPSCLSGPFDCEAWLWVLAFLGAFVVICCHWSLEGVASAHGTADDVCVMVVCRHCVTPRFLGVLGIIGPYSAAPMCQLLAHALRFGHVGACLPTIWYVPVHLLSFHRGIDPSERSHRAAYCLQQRCLVRPCVVFTNSASHPSERCHRGCLAKP